MNIKEFKQRQIKSYINKEYFKIPCKGKSTILPLALQKHYRYVDNYNVYNQDFEKGFYLGEYNTNNIENLNLQKDLTVKIKLPQEARNLSCYGANLSSIMNGYFSSDTLFDGTSVLPGRIYRPRAFGRETVSCYLQHYNSFTVASRLYQQPIGQIFYKDKILFSTPLNISYGGTVGNSNFDNVTVYFGPENPTENDIYYNKSYMFRNNDQFNICYNFFIDYNKIELKYRTRWFSRNYSGGYAGINTVPEIKIREQSLGNIQDCSTQILPQTFFKAGYVPYDFYSSRYLNSFISNQELGFNGVSNKNRKGGIL